MIVTHTIEHAREQIALLRKKSRRLALVPTMGALHDGHLSLIKLARQHADYVVISIFVNPEQFGPSEDFDNYPRNLDKDLMKCKNENVDLVFAPDLFEVYDTQHFLSIKIDSLNRHMCGGSRPGFFEGVLLIVNKLFNIVTPDVAVFGQKDIQQFLIINQMVNEFNHKIKMVMAPVERANDGLALSSRNVYLSKEERAIAPGLYRSLNYIKTQVRQGVINPSLLIEHQKSELEAKGFKIDYLNVFSYKTIEPVLTLDKGVVYIIAGAVWLGKTRLIDNILIEL
ncbi:MAG: pantoate--beta-alanine ligase [Balneolaceae bacterium]|nr:MAG: pantoate--beta-alanine ligase [Balneolaceae bacterium]